MRLLLLITAALSLVGCALMPESQPERGDEQTRPAAARSEAPARLSDAWQQLFDGRHDRALANFDEVIRLTPEGSELNARARLGQALVYAAPDWSGRDLDRAAERLEGIADPAQQADGVAVFDWILGQTVGRLIESEQRQEQLQRELAASTGRNRALQGELEQARAERAQAEETVSRLRELIMGEG
ncbi:MAG: hypothetical protein EA370_03140 [Wenzhouxiangella sp.]|nr:MAG: hypothetical protein EA370_03140 [Wenzhouxiangella sp.]